MKKPLLKMIFTLRKSICFLFFSRWLLLYTTLGLTAFFMLTGFSQQPEGPLFRVSDRAYKTLNDAVFENIGSQLFFVGEHHDNPHHHANQLAVIQEIHEKAEKPLAIGLEMFQTGYQDQLDQWVAGSLSVEEFMKIYYENWDQEWILYRDILLYAREHQIPLIGVNVPRRVVRKVAQKGFGSLTSADMEELPEGITCDVTPKYENFIKRALGWHGKKDDSLKNFCEAQILWDTAMAINLLKFHDQNPGTKLVVLAGDGHSWKPGIPRQISLRRDLSMAVFLPETAKLHRSNVLQEDTDYLWLLMYM
ncbi:MAG: ChaN family lipoprotein [Desulfobulbales bacterium]